LYIFWDKMTPRFQGGDCPYLEISESSHDSCKKCGENHIIDEYYVISGVWVWKQTEKRYQSNTFFFCFLL